MQGSQQEVTKLFSLIAKAGTRIKCIHSHSQNTGLTQGQDLIL